MAYLLTQMMNITTKVNNCLIYKSLTRHTKCQIRCLTGLNEKKRFYKNVTITQNDNKFGINLDGKQLKTPIGNVFYTHSHCLALMIANEWLSQQKTIRLSSMHLTQLCNTAIDNPTNDFNETIAQKIMDFIDSDTLCFHVNQPKELSDLQKKSWNPIIEWFQKTYNCQIPITQTVYLNPISETSRNLIYRHLCSYNMWSLIGLKFATENLKSLILSLALTQKVISVDKCVDLSRLEEDFEIEKWGRIEWSHDLELHALRARVSAALLFYLTNCETGQLSQTGHTYARSIEYNI
ncbi:ATP synthase mitochondrial F1 complex assembly factor 2-like [Oppia nitens]|uniref:ATP synthase mitochondrial F1 complex assembly factor 2-like n=1 Tax=Oppia nitens TaxID=1686743 RepID=UPI0023DB2048|nr:ATP synthase mitochondrial F1 complex assembly factor 2-like [Oppia nitens]